MPKVVTFKNSRITLDGKLFDVELDDTLRDAVGREIGKLTYEGRDMVVARLNARKPPSLQEQRRAGQPGRGRTGFTARSIEGVRTVANPLLGVIRMKPDVKRPGTTDERAAYIVNAIIESGRRGGGKVTRLRVNLTRGRARQRTAWQQGTRVQPPTFQFRSTARELNKIAPARIEAVIREGLE